jgi:hypothetical protein
LSDFLGWLAIFGTTPIGRFWGLLVAFTTAYNIKMLVFGYQSIDIHLIVMPVNFDDRLSMSILRNKRNPVETPIALLPLPAFENRDFF